MASWHALLHRGRGKLAQPICVHQRLEFRQLDHLMSCRSGSVAGQSSPTSALSVAQLARLSETAYDLKDKAALNDRLARHTPKAANK
jgi:hypothetical protein